MKRWLGVFLAVCLVLCCCPPLFAAGEAAAADPDGEQILRFRDDGTFTILMINDTQDVGRNADPRTARFLEAVLDAEAPDLVVFVGDQLADIYPFPTAEDYALAIDRICRPLEERGIPFLVTLGNHDHDRATVLDEAGQFALYDRYTMHRSGGNGPDPFTYHVEIQTHDGGGTAFNIYMMDTNNKAPEGGYAGISEAQLAWYNDVSARLRESNGGETVTSLLFQHVPVKEIHSLLKECDWSDEGAFYSFAAGGWYRLDEDKLLDRGGGMGESPASENLDRVTGEYQAWVENGDIMGAFFAHDHVNSFFGLTDEGIRMGYTGGAGFRAYGSGGKRCVRVFTLREDDVTDYATRLVFYDELMGEQRGSLLADFFSPPTVNKWIKLAYSLFGRFLGRTA